MKNSNLGKLFLCLLIPASQGFTNLVDSAEVRVAAFFPSSKRFRKVYGNVGVEYQLQLTSRFCCPDLCTECSIDPDCNELPFFCDQCEIEDDRCCPLYFCSEGWLNFSWFPKSGSPIHCKGSTNLDLFNLNLGLRVLTYNCSCNSFYLGVGPSFGWIDIKNKLKCCKGCSSKPETHSSKFGVGGIVQAGVLCQLSDCAFIDLFGEYLYLPMHFDHHVNIGGFKVGLGLGWYF